MKMITNKRTFTLWVLTHLEGTYDENGMLYLPPKRKNENVKREFLIDIATYIAFLGF
jgi:hypothetical protein